MIKQIGLPLRGRPSLSIRRFWGKRGKMEAKKGEEGLILRLRPSDIVNHATRMITDPTGLQSVLLP